MTKQPPVEFFEVTVRCPKELLGDLMADISKRGLNDVKFEHVTAVKTFNRNTKPEVSSLDFLAEWTKSNPTFKAKEAVNAFKADGRGNGTSAYHALTALVANGALKKLEEGRYSRADVKHLPAPKKAKKAKAAKKTRKHNDVSNAEFIRRAMSRAHGKISSAALKRLFESDGRVSTGVGPTLTKLREDGLVKSLGEGMYELTAKAAKRPSPKSNGAAATDVAPGV